MPRYEVLDTFPAFERFWKSSASLPPAERVDGWRREYLSPWPELWRMQAEDYRGNGVDWRSVARRRVFPTIERMLPAMRRSRAGILRAIPIATRRVRTRLGADFRVTFVIHVGIGCGAGWATTFRGAPAVLFGLENAAELQWADPTTSVALVEHELAHLAHDHWRHQAKVQALARHRGPWWRLYEEGFATRCEIRLGGIGSHHSTSRTEDWLGWCGENRSKLASLFLRAATSPASIRRFFGSWYRVEGHIETGYFLGAEVIRDWESRFSLREIACMSADQVRRRARASLGRMAAAGP
jgi:hypothetical protein